MTTSVVPLATAAGIPTRSITGTMMTPPPMPSRPAACPTPHRAQGNRSPSPGSAVVLRCFGGVEHGPDHADGDERGRRVAEVCAATGREEHLRAVIASIEHASTERGVANKRACVRPGHGVVAPSLPSWSCGFDPRHPLSFADVRIRPCLSGRQRASALSPAFPAGSSPRSRCITVGRPRARRARIDRTSESPVPTCQSAYSSAPTPSCMAPGASEVGSFGYRPAGVPGKCRRERRLRA